MLARSLLFFLLSAAAAAQTTYHVARDAPGASDGNNGLFRTYQGGVDGPWATLSAGATRAAAGDTVLVYDGDYRSEDTGWGIGVIPVLVSGTTAQGPIAFRAALGNTPLVRSLLIRQRAWIVVTGFVVDDPGLVIDYSLPWSVREPLVRQKFATYMQLVEGLEYDTAIDVKGSSDVTIRGNSFFGYWSAIQCVTARRA
ncbi:MAG: hypothetical protein GY711_07740 [bacterium]|nr:hypothetical protein [bacterium]